MSSTQNPSSGNALQGWPDCEQDCQAENLSVRFFWMGTPWTVPPPPASLQAWLFWHSKGRKGGRDLLPSKDGQFSSGPHP